MSLLKLFPLIFVLPTTWLYFNNHRHNQHHQHHYNLEFGAFGTLCNAFQILVLLLQGEIPFFITFVFCLFYSVWDICRLYFLDYSTFARICLTSMCPIFSKIFQIFQVPLAPVCSCVIPDPPCSCVMIYEYDKYQFWFQNQLYMIYNWFWNQNFWFIKIKGSQTYHDFWLDPPKVLKSNKFSEAKGINILCFILELVFDS